MTREDTRFQVAEFFAGVGLARTGLESTGAFRVVYANDIDPDKASLYRANWRGDGNRHFDVRDIHAVVADGLPPARLDLAWASFPCTDLSLAGDRNGLDGPESGTWWGFHSLLGALASEDRAPRVVAVENVHGLATSKGGRDLERVVESLNELEYACDVLSIDARHFLPQSRPRLFVIAALEPLKSVGWEEPNAARPAWISEWLRDRPHLKTTAAWLPPLPDGPTNLDDWLEPVTTDDPRWWEPERQERFVRELSDLQLERYEHLREGSYLSWRTAYRRTRRGKTAWEIRADGIAGCLRAVRGGSSLQAVVEVGMGEARVRWMTPCEYASLMGAWTYEIRGHRRNQVYFGFGDAVAVPVVAWLAENYLQPLLA
ncbi:MAG: DNA cytosine methyltransferase [Nitriliruptorales bacterium]